MTTTFVSGSPMNSNNKAHDDLTKIKGIGSVRQQWFRETFNVSTYQDLAVLSPEEIEARLRAEGRSASRNEIETWLTQAQDLAATAGQIVTDVERVKGAIMGKADNWRSLAIFTVEFREQTDAGQPAQYQTLVQHMEADANYEWSGIESQELCRWMLERVSGKVKSLPATSPLLETAPTPVAPIAVTITQVCLVQPPNAQTPTAIGEPGRLLQGVIDSAKPFALEVRFQLAQPVARGVRPITYYAQFFVRSFASGARTALGATEPAMLVADQTLYTAKLPQVKLAAGIYHLQVLVSLQSTPPSLSSFEWPMLQVA